MRLDLNSSWKFHKLDTYKQFIERYNLQDIFYAVIKKKTETLSGKEYTKENMFKLFDEELEIAKTQYNQPNDPYYILENISRMYITINNLFDIVVLIETGADCLLEVYFYSIMPNNQEDLKQFIEKHLDAYKNGFGEIVEDVIKRRS